MSKMTCSDCERLREYVRTVSNPNGYAVVYECPDCGDRKTYSEDTDRHANSI